MSRAKQPVTTASGAAEQVIRTRTRAPRAFSLVEVAIAITVVGLILGGMMIPIGQQLQDRTYRKAEDKVAAAIDAVLDYAVASSARDTRAPFLPCPAPLHIPVGTNPAGEEDSRDGNGNCLLFSGVVPWKTLGLEPGDIWGSHLTYVVHPSYANSTTGFDSSTIATLSLANKFPIYVCRLDKQKKLEEEDCVKKTDKSNVLSVNYPYRTSPPTLSEPLSKYFNPSFNESGDSHLQTYDSLPFAIISHGQDGSAGCAVGTDSPPTRETTDAESEQWNNFFSRCSSFLKENVEDDTTVQLSVNAIRNTAEHASLVALHRWSDIRAKRLISSRLLGAKTELGGDFDDIVGWMTRSELFSAMKITGKFPEHFGPSTTN